MAAPAHAEHMRGRSRPRDEAAAALPKPPGLRDSALLRWAAFLGGLCLVFLALESMIGHYDESVVGELDRTSIDRRRQRPELLCHGGGRARGV